ncbi:hypothetical protein AB1K54_01270 [Microbacterium sp. BWT-B31]|uniref:hypothetical protein n=1 Tax=Microbacterium sp. BWT-B31 TaxID=3232072 RepID=UPI003528B65A
MAAVVVASAVMTALAGCGPAPWDDPTASPTSSASTGVPTPVPNDLSTGSTQRTLTAGAVTATVDYWSDLSMDKWTASAIKPVTLSLTTTVTPDDGQKVYLQRVTMIAVPSSTSGPLTALDAQTDTATVSPGYLVLSPYSYSQTFRIGQVPDETVSVAVQFTYDFLVQATPTSTDYAKQATSDTLTIAIAG